MQSTAQIMVTLTKHHYGVSHLSNEDPALHQAASLNVKSLHLKNALESTTQQVNDAAIPVKNILAQLETLTPVTDKQHAALFKEKTAPPLKDVSHINNKHSALTTVFENTATEISNTCKTILKTIANAKSQVPVDKRGSQKIVNQFRIAETKQDSIAQDIKQLNKNSINVTNKLNELTPLGIEFLPIQLRSTTGKIPSFNPKPTG